MTDFLAYNLKIRARKLGKAHNLTPDKSCFLIYGQIKNFEPGLF